MLIRCKIRIQFRAECIKAFHFGSILPRETSDDHKRHREEPMKPGRKTTQEERVAIVQDCLNHDRNYKKTAEKYDCSYTQVRNWTLKFEQGGEEALIDGRGRVKRVDELTDTELLERKIADLERRTRNLEMETELLKKAEEWERRMIEVQ